MPDALFGPIGMWFFGYKCFYYLFFIFIYYYDTQQPWTAGQRPPHPPRLQMRAGGGHSHSLDAKHPTPPSSLENTAKGGFFHHPPSGQRRPAAHTSKRRPTQAHSSQRRPTQAHSSQRRPTQAHEGSRRPTAARAMVPQSTLPSFVMEKYIGDFIFDDEEYID
jgi:hypothetical protein